MNLTVKRCLLSLVTWATLIEVARAQTDGPVGAVQLGGQPATTGLQPVEVINQPGIVQTQPGMATPPSVFGAPQPAFGAPAQDNGGWIAPPNSGPAGGSVVPRVSNGYFGMTPLDQVFKPRFFVDSRGGGLYGYNAGYSTLGAFVPYQLDDAGILFLSGQGIVTYDGRGGASVGAGWRYWMEDIDRIAGLSLWFDFDNGHAQPYQQVGVSFESLGRYIDYRVNGYAPISNPDHVISSALNGSAILIGNGIGLIRNNSIEQSYSGFDAELGGPTPILGRYGLNAYVGGYHFIGNGMHGGQFTGVSGRLQSQINEDVSFGVQVTNDNSFGLNTQFQVFVNLPDGRPGRYLRNLRVQDRLTQNVFRQYRVAAKTDNFTSTDVAINPATHKPYFVANINPNLATNGDGSAGNPFNSIANYEALSLAQRQHYNLILVAPRLDGTSTNLDTSSTLDIFSGQRLASTSIKQTFFTDNLPGVALGLPGFTGGAAPMLVNSSGGDVITLIGGNTAGEQVSGMNIVGSATGNGIRGDNNLGVIISNNTIQSGLNGVLLTNSSGTIAGGTQAQFFDNTITNNVNNGVQITNIGAPPAVNNLDVVVTNNTFSGNGTNGLEIDARAGATISGIIGGTNTAATATTPAVTLSNTFTGNTQNGLYITANGGTLNFQSPAGTTNPFGVFNNTFTSNGMDGMLISTTNGSVASFNIANNSFGVSGTTTSGNGVNGLGLISDSGMTSMLIGGAITTNADGSTNNPGNGFFYNANNGIDFAVSGTAALSYNILNNTITNSLTATVPPPHDEFTFSFNGTSGTDPFTITNLSDPGVRITSVLWNLANTPATIAATSEISLLNPNNKVVVQPISDSFLTSVNGIGVTAGSSPLTVRALAAPGNLANNTNTGLAANTQLLPMGFTGFGSLSGSNTFNATARFEQSGGSSPLTSVATAGSTLAVTFSNGLTSTQAISLVTPTGSAVSALGSVFGTATPGFGSGNDGIHILTSGSSTVNPSNIISNTISGVGHFGIEVSTAGTSNSSNIVIENNTLRANGTGINGAGVNVFSGGAMNLTQADSSTFNALVENNDMTNNFNGGLFVNASGTAAGSMVVTSISNQYTNNFGNGLNISSSGATNLTFTSTNDVVSNNGLGSSRNPGVATSGDNIALFASGTSNSVINLNSITSNSAAGSGLSATTTNGSSLTLTIQSPTTTSSFANNAVDGILLTSNDTSLMHVGIYNTLLNANKQDGIGFQRNGASLVLATIGNTSMNNNGRNGLFFQGLGSDPTDPTQQFSGTANTINLVSDTLNGNGTQSAAGNGLMVQAYGQSAVVVNALATTFDNNVGNGMHFDMTPGANVGNSSAGISTVFDNVDIENNTLNGILLTSQRSAAPTADPQSRTLLDINSTQGATVISNNGGDGILMQYQSGIQNISIEGNSTFATVIQNNALDGIHADIGNFANATVTVDTVLIGGATKGLGNKGDGIGIDTVMDINLGNIPNPNNNATSAAYITSFDHAGTGTLNLNNSIVENNAGNGITLYGNGLSGTGFGQANYNLSTTNLSEADGFGQINANITNNLISNNGLAGVNIQLLGRMGGIRWPNFSSNSTAPLGYDTITLTNNTIVNNGTYGIFYQANPAIQTNLFYTFFSPDIGAPPNFPLQPTDLAPAYGFNYSLGVGNAVIDGVKDAGFLSDWLLLPTYSNTLLNVVNNTIQGNGLNHDGANEDAIKLRVGTDSYLGANIQGNNLTGNVGNSLRIESFVQYNPITGVAELMPASTHGSATTPSIVFPDRTAQLDLRLVGNVGNGVNIVNPLTNLYGTSLGSASPNGAVYPWDPQKDRTITNGSDGRPVRLAQLFELDNGTNVNANNSFTSGGVTVNLLDAFYNGDFWNRAAADPLFPNPLFPPDSITSPGVPFLP